MLKKDNNKENNSNKETWRFWDWVLFSGLFSLFVDNKESQNDDKKFKQILYQFLFAIIFTGILFVIGFWIYNPD